jgi:hypothetical protein
MRRWDAVLGAAPYADPTSATIVTIPIPGRDHSFIRDLLVTFL